MARSRQIWRSVTLMVACLTIAAAASAPAVAAGPARQPGELVLSRQQRDRALANMGAEERSRREARWNNPSNLPVAYAQAYYRLKRDNVGKLVPVEVGSHWGAEPNFRVPSMTTAATWGSGGRYDLYISVAVVRQTCFGCYQWAIDNWVDWRGTGGMNNANLAEESFGTSWAGDLYLHADTSAGTYMSLANGMVRNLDIYRSDATPNEGVGWSFHEWWRPCGQCTGTPANWADGTAYIREDSWKSRTDNVVHKYFHTTSTGDSFSLSFYNAGVSITPQNNQWSVAAYASFSH